MDYHLGVNAKAATEGYNHSHKDYEIQGGPQSAQETSHQSFPPQRKDRPRGENPYTRSVPARIFFASTLCFPSSCSCSKGKGGRWGRRATRRVNYAS